MAYITNQWLKNPARKAKRRGHHPVAAKASYLTPGGKWDAEHGIVMNLRFKRSDGDYQGVYLSDEDLPTLAKAISRMNSDSKAKFLSRFVDAEVEMLELMPSGGRAELLRDLAARIVSGLASIVRTQARPKTVSK